jgi:O-antigen/teichoic acid export membrane protein
LPAADVGVIFMGMSAAAFISLAANGGYSMLALTELPRLALTSCSSLTSAFHRLVLRDGFVALALCFLLVFLARHFMGFTDGQNMALLFGCLSAPTASLIRYYSAIATSNRRLEVAYVPDFLVRPTILLVYVAVAWFLGYKVGMVDVLVVFTLASVIAAIGQAIALRPQGIAFTNWSAPRQKFAAVLRSRAFALTIVAASLLATADIITLVAGFILPASDVAVVGITIRLAALIGYVLQAGQQFVMPDFTQAVLRGDEKTANGLVLRMSGVTLLTLFAALVGAAVLGEWALSIFGQEYVRGAWILFVFLVAQAVRSLSGMNQHLLSIRGFQMRTAGGCLLALVVMVCLAALLSHRLGLDGLAYAVLVSEIVWLLVLASQAMSLTGQRADIFWVMRKTLKRGQ